MGPPPTATHGTCQPFASWSGSSPRPKVTFLVGDNGAGKSTLVEAMAVAAGFNAEGGGTAIHETANTGRW